MLEARNRALVGLNVCWWVETRGWWVDMGVGVLKMGADGLRRVAGGRKWVLLSKHITLIHWWVNMGVAVSNTAASGFETHGWGSRMGACGYNWVQLC